MSRSKRRSPASGAAGKRLQTVGLFLTLLLVAVLVGSLAAGLVGGRGGAAPPAADEPDRGAGEARRGNAPPPAGRVRVEVLNASGVPGVAARGRTLLRDRGFDVVYVGNAEGYPPDTSLVLDRVGRMELARAVADEIDIPRVVARPDSNVYADVTVVLGRDWVAGHAEAAPGN
ncbi:MAG TPA: LytR C-terminal domain-containing protein [Longimicrobium sp.]|nr:LytR C-terminal domain-containing protein [Longimicrobium sp.]